MFTLSWQSPQHINCSYAQQHALVQIACGQHVTDAHQAMRDTSGECFGRIPPDVVGRCALQLRQDMEKRDAKDKEKERQEALEEKRLAKRAEEQVGYLIITAVERLSSADLSLKLSLADHRAQDWAMAAWHTDQMPCRRSCGE